MPTSWALGAGVGLPRTQAALPLWLCWGHSVHHPYGLVSSACSFSRLGCCAGGPVVLALTAPLAIALLRTFNNVCTYETSLYLGSQAACDTCEISAEAIMAPDLSHSAGLQSQHVTWTLPLQSGGLGAAHTTLDP
jgi:hypothetical protein